MKKILLFMVMVFSFGMVAKATTEYFNEDIYKELLVKVDEINESNTCYNSVLTTNGDYIYINVERKDDVVEEDCPLSDDNGDLSIMIQFYKSEIYYDMDELESEIVNYDDSTSYNANLESFINLDIAWFDTLLDVVGKNVTFEELKNGSKKASDYHLSFQYNTYFYNVISSDASGSGSIGSYSRFYYPVQTHIFFADEAFEITDTTDTTITYTYYISAVSTFVCGGTYTTYLSTDGINYTKLVDPVSGCYLVDDFDYATPYIQSGDDEDTVVIKNLEPNTTYYVKIIDNNYGYGESTFIVTTKASTKTEENTTTTSDVTKVDNTVSVDTKTTTDSSGFTNPSTGATISIVSIIILLVIGTFIVYKVRKSNKVFKI